MPSPTPKFHSVSVMSTSAALGQLDAVGAVVEELDAVREAVDARDLAGEVDDRALLDREDARGARLAGEVGQQAGAGPDVDDDVTGTHDLVDRLAEAVDAVGVGEQARVVLQDPDVVQPAHGPPT